MSVKIAYQGIAGSNSAAAAEEMAAKLELQDPQYLPMVDSKGVVEALLQDLAQYGVMAIENVIAGPVVETVEETKKVPHRVLLRHRLPIHHCVFVKPGVKAEEVIQVTSHIQALTQCRQFIAQTFGDAPQVAVEDTALAAVLLTEGTLPEKTAVLCRRNAGEPLGLQLLFENVEDDKQNFTDFILIEKEN